MVKLLLEQPNIDVNALAVYHQNDTNNPYYDTSINEEEENNDIEGTGFVDDNQNTIIVKRTALQFAYAGKSQDIIQLLLSRTDIENTNEKEEGNDILIKKFTRDIK